MEKKRKMINKEEEELDKAYKIFTGNVNKEETVEESEENEPYEEIEETSVKLTLPFDVAEGDMLDLNAYVSKVNDDGTVEIVIDKAFKK